MAMPSSPSRSERRWIPSRPTLRDWFYAGALAGMCLGIAEVTPLVLLGKQPSEPFAALVVLVPTALTVFMTLCLAPFFQGRIWDFGRSELVGVVLGPLLFVASLGGVIEALGGAFGLGLLYVGVAGLGASVTGLLGCRAGAHLEARGLPLNGPVVWTVAAAFVALTEQALHLPRWRGLAVLALSLGLLLGVSWAFLERAKQKSQPPRSWAKALRTAAVLAFLLVVGPRFVPMLLSDPENPRPLHPRPNLLVVSWPGDPELLRSSIQESSALSQFRGRGVIYDELARVSDDVDAVPDWLMDRDRVPLLATWAARGYETIEIVTRAESRAGAVERNWAAGGRTWLASSGQRTTAGRVITALGFGASEDHRNPSQLLGSAESWLLRQADAAGTGPFAMYLDFRGRRALDGPTLDRQFDRVVETLDHWGGIERCVVVVMVEGSSGLRSALLRPAETDLRLDRGVRVRQPVHPSEFARALSRAMDLRSHHAGS